MAYKRSKSGDVEILDVGDVEAVRFKGGIVVGMPKERDTLFIKLGSFVKPATIEKLESVVGTPLE